MTVALIGKKLFRRYSMDQTSASLDQSRESQGEATGQDIPGQDPPRPLYIAPGPSNDTHTQTTVLQLPELAMRHDLPEVKHRKGNWVQPYGPDDDARLFVNAQFRRYRELADKYLPKLKDTAAIGAKVKGGKP